MSPKKLRIMRRLAAFLSVGAIAFQTGPCGLSDQQFGALLQTGADLFTRQLANIVSDTVFFLLDNIFVRLTAA